MGSIDEIEARHEGDVMGAAKEIGRGLICGNKAENLTGFEPKSAARAALIVLHPHPKTVEDILAPSELVLDIDQVEVYAHLLGFHDALLKDRKAGYKVPDGWGEEYEEGHRLGAELDREKLNFCEREVQGW